MPLTTSSDRTVSQHIEEESFEEVKTTESKFYLISKRLMDVSLAVTGLLVLLPLLLLVALLIKIEDKKESVLFSQIRTGKDGKEFKMYKFRSMVSNAEELKASLLTQNEAEGPVFKMRDDPRITKIGKFIRMTSIDELPQLFNILKGDMSLVGPRPALPEEVEQYSSYERQRLRVVPGLTCYWQVSGRSNIGFSEWVELDLKYIREKTLLVDIKLIIKTCFVLFGSKDAF